MAKGVATVRDVDGCRGKCFRSRVSGYALRLVHEQRDLKVHVRKIDAGACLKLVVAR